MSTTRSLPVLMYHYISRYPGAISVHPDRFEEHCRGMAEHGWHGISLAEAEAYFLHGESLPPKSVLITFDDGFLDNYVYAWPLLHKYGHQGVIFAVTDRIETTSEVRPTLGSGAIPPGIDDPMYTNPDGFKVRQDRFFSWEEARLMEQSGVMSIAAHSARHLAVFASSQWGLRRHHKPHDLASRFRIPSDQTTTFFRVTDDLHTIFGLPRFKERPALHSRAFLPSSDLINAVRNLVPQSPPEAAHFFTSSTNIAQLEALIDTHSNEALGSLETPEAREHRLTEELSLCASTLTRELGHPIRSFCWPWGSGSDLALSIAHELGFSAFFSTRMGANPPCSPRAIKRFKVRDAGWNWLKYRLFLYSHPLTASLYAKIRI